MGVENNCAYLATLQLKPHNFHWSFYVLSWLVSLLTNMKTRRGFRLKCSLNFGNRSFTEDQVWFSHEQNTNFARRNISLNSSHNSSILYN